MAQAIHAFGAVLAKTCELEADVLSDPLVHRLNSRVEVPVVPVHDDLA
jgi:hypothetical protein